MERCIRAARVLGIPMPQRPRRSVNYMVVWAVFLAATLLPAAPILAVGSFTSSKVALGDPRPSTTSVNYTFTASTVTTSLTKCIKLVFATTATGSTVPTSFDSSVGAVALNTAGTNYVPTPASLSLNKATNGTLLLTDSSGQTPASATGRTVSIDGITNSSVADTSYYLRVSTFSNTDCATGPIDAGTVQFINTSGSTVSLSVDPTLSFSVGAIGSSQSCDTVTTTQASTATTLPFGSVTSASNQILCQDLLAATNAAGGYTIYVRYTGAPQSGVSTIHDLGSTNAAPGSFTAAGTENYGYSTDDATLGTGTANRFTNPSQKWAAVTTSNAEVGYESGPVTSTHYKVAHQVGVAVITPAGTYTTTIIYTCTPIY